MSAVTDSGNEIKFDPANKPAISNLLAIYSQMSNLPVAEIERKFTGKNYSAFKAELVGVIIEKLKPIQDTYAKLAKNKTPVLKTLKEGALRAEKVAEATMNDVRKKIGLLEA